MSAYLGDTVCAWANRQNQVLWAEWGETGSRRHVCVALLRRPRSSRHVGQTSIQCKETLRHDEFEVAQCTA